MNGNSFQYSYDGNGMRYKKVVNGKTTEYYYNGTQLLAEYNKNTWEMKYYFYDQTGVAGMIYEGRFGGIRYYYFDKNTLGDVIAVRDAYGDVIAKYKYDAWGNILEETNLYNSDMASKNPFRYRGYYYDTETGFYYLQTRYYDPEIGRFINADDYELVGTLASVPGQLNMYAYCGNNPVMYTDESGEFFLTALLVGLISGIVIGGAIGGAVAISNGATPFAVVGAVAEGMLKGGAIGLAIGALIGIAPTIGGLIGGIFTGTAGAGATVAAASSMYVVAAGATAAFGMNLLFSKGSGARFGHNQYENDQFRDVMKELGIDRTNPQWEKAHRALMRYKKGGRYFDKYRDLLKFIKSILGV